MTNRLSKSFVSAILVSALAFGASVAVAAPSYCSVAPALATTTNDDGLSRSNVTFRAIASDGCYGVVSGNDSLNWVNGNNGGTALFGGSWENSVKDDGAAGTLNGYLGLNWTLDAPQNQQSGNWTLTLADPPPVSLPVAVDLLVVLKGGTSWAAYFFDEEVFTLAGANSGTFSIQFLNNGNQIPGLSHMTLYLRKGSTEPSCQPGDPNCNPPCVPGTPGCNSTSVPEPTSLALLGLALAGLAGVRRRRVD